MSVPDHSQPATVRSCAVRSIFAAGTASAALSAVTPSSSLEASVQTGARCSCPPWVAQTAAGREPRFVAEPKFGIPSPVMSVLPAAPSVVKPGVADLLARAGAIAELARERVRQTEADRRISAEMTEHMRQADLLRVMQPEAYGGFEYGFDVFFPIVAAIARGCGSTGWVYGLLASH